MSGDLPKQTPADLMAEACVLWAEPWTENFNDDLRRMALAIKHARQAFAIIAEGKVPMVGADRGVSFQGLENKAGSRPR